MTSSSLRLPALLTAAAVLATGCDLFEPRDPEVEFEDKICGSTDENRDPVPAVPVQDAVLSGAVKRTDDGGLEVVLAPLIVGTADVTAALDADAMTVEIDGEVVTDFELLPVSNEVPASVDVMFVLDTTGSMLWAIDGMRSGIDLFLDGLDATGLDARVGGIEFGDELRSQIPLGESAEMRRWLDLLTATGGGDGPESPLDAMEKAYADADWREGALRYVVVITDVGFHEDTDGSECSETNLASTVDAMKGESLLTVVHAGSRGGAGVDPDWLVRAMGGLYVSIDGSFLFSSDFDISLDTPADDILSSTHVLSVPAASADGANTVSLRYQLGGETLRYDAQL